MQPKSNSEEIGSSNSIACPMYAGSVSLPWKEWIRSMASSSSSHHSDNGNTFHQGSAKYMMTSNADETMRTAIQQSARHVLVNDLQFTPIPSTNSNDKQQHQQYYVLGDKDATVIMTNCLHNDNGEDKEIGAMSAMVLQDFNRPHRIHGKKYSVGLKIEAKSDDVLQVICSEVDRALLLLMMVTDSKEEDKHWCWEDEQSRDKHARGDDVLLRESTCMVKWIEGMLQQQAVIAAASADSGVVPVPLKDIVGLEALQNDVIQAMMATNTFFQ